MKISNEIIRRINFEFDRCPVDAYEVGLKCFTVSLYDANE